MTAKQPPAAATWLLKHFGCGPNNDSVLGDLAEQFGRKSRMWYWRQVLKGIPVSIAREALGHKAIAARAIVAGCIAWFVFVAIYPGLAFGFAPRSGPTFDLFSYLVHPLVAWAAGLIALTAANTAIAVFGILLGGSVRRSTSADMRTMASPR